MEGNVGYDENNFKKRMEEYYDDAFGDKVLTLNDVRESDTGTYSCSSMEHSSLNDTIYVFVHRKKVFLPLKSVMIIYKQGEVMVPCKTTKFVDKSDIELYASNVLVKEASKYNYDQRYGFKITKKLYSEKQIVDVNFECRYKKEENQTATYIITEKEASSDDGYHFSWEKGFQWPHVGYNFSLTCNLNYNGSKIFHGYTNKLSIECPQCSHDPGSHVHVDRHRIIGNKISTTVRIQHLELEDSGKYTCIWEHENKETKYTDYHLYVAPKKAQIKVIETSPTIMRIKENRATSLTAKFAIYPFEKESYTAKWSRIYNSSIHEGPQSETIINDDFRKIAATSFGDGAFSENLDIKAFAVSTNMSGTYVLSISHMDTVQVVQWEVAIENDEPDVQITVREPSSFFISNQEYYKPDTNLHIECISISIPPADVVFEYKTKNSEQFQEIEPNKLVSVGGTFDRGLIYNVTFTEGMDLKCSSIRKGNRAITVNKLIKIGEGFEVRPHHEKSSKATESEPSKIIYEGDNVKLTCVFPLDSDDWSVSWRFENSKSSDISSIPTTTETEIKQYSKHLILNLRDVTTSFTGTYTCVVKNEDSEKLLETSIDVKAISKPSITGGNSNAVVIVDYDQYFEINCNMTGTPPPVYQWFKDGNPYTHGDVDGSILRVSRARGEDDGEFHCLATNRAGDKLNSIEVQVNNAPKGSLFFYWFLALLLLISIIAVFLLTCKLRASNRLTKQKDIALNTLYETMIKHQAGPLPEEMKDLPVEERTYYLPYNNDYEIDPVNLEILNPIGSGHFGVVKKGLLGMAYPKSKIESKTRLPVAVKSSTNPFNVELQKMMAEELKVMCAIPKNPNVLALIGAVTKNMRQGQLYIVTEFIDGGNLREFLQAHRNTFINELVEDEHVPVDDSYLVPNSVKKKIYKFDEKLGEGTRLLVEDPDALCTSDLLSIGLQIAKGMAWLADVPCVHRDLACRNVLITKTKIVRIADFGLSKKHTNKTYYRTKKSKDTPLPVRWMPLECIEEFKFTQKSDVWSFGICLYEIFTLGGTPYPNCDTFNVIEFIRNGNRNKQPEYCHDEIYELMKVCWQFNPKDRPTFNDCITFFENHMRDSSSQFLERVENMLHTEMQEQSKLDDWIQDSRPDVPNVSFQKSPKKQKEERYLIVESHA